ncbi:MAG: formate/nitrite transporter family protein [Tepidanaerobacteraceae bacterium]|jgi:formate/nitrite transporter|nr:formate/nitrite transporter family protein [Tepidanaerobacteraceae bacterium]
MHKNFLSPVEIAEATITAGIKKANLSTVQMILLGFFAGAFIAFGANADIVIMQTFKRIDVGLMKFLGAAVFPVGLMLVVIAGAELFTGNNLMTLALFDKKITVLQLLKNWFLVYTGNFLGSVFIAYIVSASGLLTGPAADTAMNIANAKLSLDFASAFLRGIGCNMLVVLAVWLATSAQDVTSKILSCWFPIMLFVLSGFEHSIANMFFLPAARFLGLQVSWSKIWFDNLLPVTLGNIVGGAVMVPAVYYLCYILPERKKDFQSSKAS